MVREVLRPLALRLGLLGAKSMRREMAGVAPLRQTLIMLAPLHGHLYDRAVGHGCSGSGLYLPQFFEVAAIIAPGLGRGHVAHAFAHSLPFATLLEGGSGEQSSIEGQNRGELGRTHRGRSRRARSLLPEDFQQALLRLALRLLEASSTDCGALSGVLLPCPPSALSRAQLIALEGILEAIQSRAMQIYEAAVVRGGEDTVDDVECDASPKVAAVLHIQANVRGRAARARQPLA